MHLSPREHERLLLAAGADLARRRLARGSRVGAAEAVALVCDEICELAWDGVPLADVVERARGVVPPDALVDGVASAVPSLQVEALFPHGTVLVHVDAPFGLARADGPGAVRVAADGLELSPGRARSVATLRNRGSLAIWVSSHVPLSEVNGALEVSPARLRDHRVDLPAGAAVKVEPGESADVEVVALGRGSR